MPSPSGRPVQVVLLGAVLIVAAMVGASLVTVNQVPSPIRIVVYVLAVIAALAGSIMTLKDGP